MLIHGDRAPAVLPGLLRELGRHGVEIRGCPRTLELVRPFRPAGLVLPATEDDWRTEYGALVLACRIVDDIDAALRHIDAYGSRHTEAIVTADESAARHFLAAVDAASVIHNASTRFADGYRYGLGAEVGISTGKLHARGPVGLAGLTTTKWILRGGGQLVASYAGNDARAFRHERQPVE